VRIATRAQFVQKGAARRFMEEFASSQEIAVRYGTHVRILVPELKRRGIMPAIGRDLVGQHFYRRADVEGIDFPVPKRLRRRRGLMHEGQ
jgi:hypothetical protein